jgi:hypothetical protein
MLHPVCLQAPFIASNNPRRCSAVVKVRAIPANGLSSPRVASGDATTCCQEISPAYADSSSARIRRSKLRRICARWPTRLENYQ